MSRVEGSCDDLSLDGRRALITGAGSGMGRATTLLLAARGAEVIATDVNAVTAAETAEMCEATGATAHSARIDVSDYDEVATVLARLDVDHGPIDVGISCAGIATLNRIVDASEEDLDSILAVNLGGTYAMTRELLPGMRDRGWGRLIGFSSLNAKTPPPEISQYSAAKAAIIGFTQAVALEAAPAVTVNCVCPGMINTPMALDDLEYARQTDPTVVLDDLFRLWARDIPAGRMGEPDDVAQTIAFLVSERASFVTGQAINVSGGQEMG
jgi:NAD(P)-dependent dehydrogenase (short-subunit alcohol dehydrogenase family)